MILPTSAGLTGPLWWFCLNEWGRNFRRTFFNTRVEGGGKKVPYSRGVHSSCNMRIRECRRSQKKRLCESCVSDETCRWESGSCLIKSDTGSALTSVEHCTYSVCQLSRGKAGVLILPGWVAQRSGVLLTRLTAFGHLTTLVVGAFLMCPNTGCGGFSEGCLDMF